MIQEILDQYNKSKKTLHESTSKYIKKIQDFINQPEFKNLNNEYPLDVYLSYEFIKLVLLEDSNQKNKAEQEAVQSFFKLFARMDCRVFGYLALNRFKILSKKAVYENKNVLVDAEEKLLSRAISQPELAVDYGVILSLGNPKPLLENLIEGSVQVSEVVNSIGTVEVLNYITKKKRAAILPTNLDILCYLYEHKIVLENPNDSILVHCGDNQLSADAVIQTLKTLEELGAFKNKIILDQMLKEMARYTENSRCNKELIYLHYQFLKMEISEKNIKYLFKITDRHADNPVSNLAYLYEAFTLLEANNCYPPKYTHTAGAMMMNPSQALSYAKQTIAEYSKKKSSLAIQHEEAKNDESKHDVDNQLVNKRSPNPISATLDFILTKSILDNVIARYDSKNQNISFMRYTANSHYIKKIKAFAKLKNLKNPSILAKLEFIKLVLSFKNEKKQGEHSKRAYTNFVELFKNTDCRILGIAYLPEFLEAMRKPTDKLNRYFAMLFNIALTHPEFIIDCSTLYFLSEKDSYLLTSILKDQPQRIPNIINSIGSVDNLLSLLDSPKTLSNRLHILMELYDANLSEKNRCSKLLKTSISERLWPTGMSKENMERGTIESLASIHTLRIVEILFKYLGPKERNPELIDKLLDNIHFMSKHFNCYYKIVPIFARLGTIFKPEEIDALFNRHADETIFIEHIYNMVVMLHESGAITHENKDEILNILQSPIQAMTFKCDRLCRQAAAKQATPAVPVYGASKTGIFKEGSQPSSQSVPTVAQPLATTAMCI